MCVCVCVCVFRQQIFLLIYSIKDDRQGIGVVFFYYFLFSFVHKWDVKNLDVKQLSFLLWQLIQEQAKANKKNSASNKYQGSFTTTTTTTREWVETVQTTALSRSVRILRRVLETWGHLQSLKLQWKTND